MKPRSGRIRTPDQRLRVFVSSTLEELGAERRASRAAIEALRMAPVMFELGARPHPPRDLYRAYLEQSEVFVGLYWERYGWVAPDEEVSGLEDEYDLVPADMPKLIYIKASASREPRLVALIDRIRSDDTASYKSFDTAEELGEYLRGDLATLLAERFDQTRVAPDAVDDAAASVTASASETGAEASSLPTPLTKLIGREHEVAAVVGMLTGTGSTPEPSRLVTILGPGGIGKSRLAIEVGRRVGGAYPGGVVFVPLASATSEKLVMGAMAQALGVRDTGDLPLRDKLATALAGRRVLLLLDNFEQVIGAAPVLAELLAALPELSLLVTSRTRLRLSAEHAFELDPLALPHSDSELSVSQVAAVPSVALFVERVRAIRPDFELTASNAPYVAGICVALDGVPLALELAAARIRVLTPKAMLKRLGRQLPLLVEGVQDLPERQRTLRGTIEWSIRLLGDDERRMLSRLGVFAGPFPLEAAEAVWAQAGETSDALLLLGSLVDGSLVRQREHGDRSLFSLLSTVREYAREQLAAEDALEPTRRAHADYFLQLSEDLWPELNGPLQAETLHRLAEEHDDVRAAVRFLLDDGDLDDAARFAWNLYMYWWVDGHLGEVRGWMDELLAPDATVTGSTRAVALYFTRAITFWQDPDGLVVDGLTESAELFRLADEPTGSALALVSLALALLSSATPDSDRADEVLETSLGLFRDARDRWGEAMALVSIGRVALLNQKVHAALNRFEESLELAEMARDELGTAIALHHLGWVRLLLGETDAAATSFRGSLAISVRLGHDEGVAYGLEGLVAVAASRGGIDRAGRLAGAARIMRQRTGIYNAPTFSFHDQYLEQIRAAGAGAALDAALLAGEALPVPQAVALGLEEPS